MLTFILMILLVIFLGYLLIVRDERGKCNAFFDLDSTTTMRGFWCLMIMLVHVPGLHQNPVQDALGSFAYIGVTFFFMTSSYGLMLAVKKHPNTALEGFWKRRLLKLLLPILVVNLVTFALDAMFGHCSFWTLLRVAGFVKQLLVFYLIFWAVFRIPSPWLTREKRERILCASVALFSFIIYLMDGFGVLEWPTEAFGFLYGILLARHAERFAEKASTKWLLKCTFCCVAALLLGMFYLEIKQVPFFGDYITKILLGACLLTFALLVTVGYPIGNKIGRFLGGISYEIYLMHGPVYRYIDYICPSLNSGVYILSSIFITILLSMAVYWISGHLCSRR